MQTTTVHAAEAALSQAPRIRVHAAEAALSQAPGPGYLSHEYSPDMGHEPIATLDKAMGIVDY